MCSFSIVSVRDLFFFFIIVVVAFFIIFHNDFQPTSRARDASLLKSKHENQHHANVNKNQFPLRLN